MKSHKATPPHLISSKTYLKVSALSKTGLSGILTLNGVRESEEPKNLWETTMLVAQFNHEKFLIASGGAPDRKIIGKYFYTHQSNQHNFIHPLRTNQWKLRHQWHESKPRFLLAMFSSAQRILLFRNLTSSPQLFFPRNAGWTIGAGCVWGGSFWVGAAWNIAAISISSSNLVTPPFHPPQNLPELKSLKVPLRRVGTVDFRLSSAYRRVKKNNSQPPLQ